MQSIGRSHRGRRQLFSSFCLENVEEAQALIFSTSRDQFVAVSPVLSYQDKMISERHSSSSSSIQSESEEWNQWLIQSPKTMLTEDSVLRKRDLEFPQHDVTVVRRKECTGPSCFYEAQPNPSSVGDRNFLMKATCVATREQARRAEAEVRTLRRLPDHRIVLKLIDSGCSAMESDPDTKMCDDDVLLDVQRVYCLLFKECQSRSLRDIIQKHRLKLDKRHSSGWIKVETALGMFRQMAVAVSILHDGRSNPIVHMDLRPEHFAAFKTSRDVTKGCKYIIKLVGAGCAIEGEMPLYSVADRMKAARLIDSYTILKYRAPEMINLQLADELNDCVDIWALGCCLYGILFLEDCFPRQEGRLNILKGTYNIPHGHPYSNDVLDLLARMLSVDPLERPKIHEVIAYVDALASGESLPARRRKQVRRATTGSAPSATSGSYNQDKVTIGLSRRHKSSNCSEAFGSQGDGTLSTWGYESDTMSTSVETEWLEFVPDDMSGSCHRRYREPTSPPANVCTEKRKKSKAAYQDCSAGTSASSLTSGMSNDTESRISNWTYGVIDRMSSKCLIFVDDDSADEDQAGDSCFHVGGLSQDTSAFSLDSELKAPSGRELGASSGSDCAMTTNTSPTGISSPSLQPNNHWVHFPKSDIAMTTSFQEKKLETVPGVRKLNSSPHHPQRPRATTAPTERIFHGTHRKHSHDAPVSRNNNRHGLAPESLPFLPPPSPRKTREKGKLVTLSKPRKQARRRHS